MRSISYSPNNSHPHSRRNTLNTVTVPIIKPSQMNSMTTLTTASSSTDQSSMDQSSMDQSSIPNSIEQELSQDSNGSYIAPNVRIINMRDPINITVPEDAVLTPDKDHGLKKSLDIDIKQPQYEYVDSPNSDQIIMDTNHLKNAFLNQPNSNISVHSNISLQSNESEVILPDQNNLTLDKVQIYSQSRSSAPSITHENDRNENDQEKP